MFPADKGTRDLLPFLTADSNDVTQSESTFDGDPASASDLPAQQGPSAMQQAASAMLVEQDHASGYSMPPINAPGNSPSAFHASGGLSDDIAYAQIASPWLDTDVTVVKARVIPRRGKIDERSDQDDGKDHGPAGKKGEDKVGSSSHRDGEKGGQSGPLKNDEVGNASGGNDADSTEDDRGHTINVSQIADVDQDAAFIIHGYAGKVVARLHIDQDLMMDQDVDISLALDGDGHFNVYLDQDMRIEQDIDIDLKMFDVDGVLYVDLFLKDRIEVEQDTSLQVKISDGPPGGSVHIDQDIDLDQDVDIDIDIEDDLEERYFVKVDIDVQQDVDVDQDAAVAIVDRAGDLDLDIDALQTAFVEQDTVVRIDFAQV